MTLILSKLFSLLNDAILLSVFLSGIRDYKIHVYPHMAYPYTVYDCIYLL